MSELVRGRSLGEAWLNTLRRVNSAPTGELVHVLTSVSEPWLPEDPAIRAALDEALVPRGTGARSRLQTVDTIANTIFPWSLYPDPVDAWSPEPDADNSTVDAAAERLYTNYAYIFTRLGEAHHENKKGTYFSRMISWPGKEMGQFNQIAKRIAHLRVQNNPEHHKSAFNAGDIAVSEPGLDLASTSDVGDLGMNTYAANDNRTRSFPCLVHVDVGLFQDKINLLGVYRHQFLIQKGYGNMIGLARLQRFLAQQTGYGVGELAIQATLATSEQGTFGKRGVDRLIHANLQPDLGF